MFNIHVDIDLEGRSYEDVEKIILDYYNNTPECALLGRHVDGVLYVYLLYTISELLSIFGWHLDNIEREIKQMGLKATKITIERVP